MTINARLSAIPIPALDSPAGTVRWSLDYRCFGVNMTRPNWTTTASSVAYTSSQMGLRECETLEEFLDYGNFGDSARAGGVMLGGIPRCGLLAISVLPDSL